MIPLSLVALSGVFASYAVGLVLMAVAPAVLQSGFGSTIPAGVAGTVWCGLGAVVFAIYDCPRTQRQ